jgi:hypothetical protein
MEGESEGQREKTRAQESERTFTRVREPGAQARERSYQPISLSVSLPPSLSRTSHPLAGETKPMTTNTEISERSLMPLTLPAGCMQNSA